MKDNSTIPPFENVSSPLPDHGTLPPPPPEPTVRYVESVSPYRVVCERTFGGPTRYEAEAPTAQEALDLLASLDGTEKKIRVTVRGSLEEVKRERDELRQVLRPLIAIRYANGVCYGCGNPEEVEHEPGCVVLIAARCLPPE